MNNGFTSDASDLSYYLGVVWSNISTAGDGDFLIVSNDYRVTAVGFFSSIRTDLSAGRHNDFPNLAEDLQ